MIVGARDAANAAGVVAVVRAERRGGGEGRAKRRHRGPEARAAGPAREEVWGSSDPRAPARKIKYQDAAPSTRTRKGRPFSFFAFFAATFLEKTRTNRRFTRSTSHFFRKWTLFQDCHHSVAFAPPQRFRHVARPALAAYAARCG